MRIKHVSKNNLGVESAINEMLEHIRNNPDYWIVNSQIYFEIMKKVDPEYLDNPNNLQINKELISTYNYIYNNRDCIKTEFENNIEKMSNHQLYFDLVNFVNKEEYFSIENYQKFIFRNDLIVMIYKHFIKQNKISDESHSNFKLKFQNFIIFHSIVSIQNSEIKEIFTSTQDDVEIIGSQSKKLRLRDSKYKNIDMDELYVKKMASLIELREKIDKIKAQKIFCDFIDFIKQNNFTEFITYEESQKVCESLKVMKKILYAYQLLLNVLKLSRVYVSRFLNSKKNSMETSDVSDNHPKKIDDFLEIYNISLNLFSRDLDEHTLIRLIEFYEIVVEKKHNYNGCIEMIRKYNIFNKTIQNEQSDSKYFGSKFKKEDIELLHKEYIEKYYENQEMKNERLYKKEFQSLSWNKEDYDNFFEGFKKFKNHQLANNKIAKFMGPHIEVNHVRFFKNKLLLEERKKNKEEKHKRIREMNKKKNFQWKITNEK